MKPLFRIGFFLVTATCLLLVAGCTALKFSVSFDRVDGLKKQDPVMLKGTTVGKVADVTYTAEGRFMVALEIPDRFSHAATTDSKFFVGKSPENPLQKAILIEQSGRPGSQKITRGQVIRGSQKEEPGAAPGTSGTAKALETLFKPLEQSLKDILSGFKDLPETEEFQELKKKMAELEKRFKESGAEINDTIRTDVLPKLEEKLRKLAETLRQQGREKKAQSLEQDLDRLRDY